MIPTPGDISNLPDGTYYIYATITDGTSGSTSYAPSSITIERELPTIRIPLQAGWNLISFSTAICWYDTQDAPAIPLPIGTELQRVASLKEVLGSINGKYLMIRSNFTGLPNIDRENLNVLLYGI